MPIIKKDFKICLLVTALLGDKYNKAGHMRNEARKVSKLYEEKLLKFGKIMNPDFFEYEDQEVKSANFCSVYMRGRCASCNCNAYS